MRRQLVLAFLALACYEASAGCVNQLNFYTGSRCSVSYFPLVSGTCYKGSVYISNTAGTYNFASTKVVAGDSSVMWYNYNDDSCNQQGFEYKFGCDGQKCTEINFSWTVRLAGTNVLSFDEVTHNNGNQTISGDVQALEILKVQGVDAEFTKNSSTQDTNIAALGSCATCYWGSSQPYSCGATTCQNRHWYFCNDGTWEYSGGTAC